MAPKFTVRIYHLDEKHFATLRAAVDFYDRWKQLGRLIRFGHFVDIDDPDGLSENERDVLSMPDCMGRDVLIALIDGAADECAA